MKHPLNILTEQKAEKYKEPKKITEYYNKKESKEINYLLQQNDNLSKDVSKIKEKLIPLETEYEREMQTREEIKNTIGIKKKFWK